jgi:hypothetical protein
MAPLLNNLAVVVYTNETNFPVLNLFLQYFRKHCPVKDAHVYVITNRVPETVKYTENITYLPGNAEFDGQGRHFSETLKNTLPQIDGDYIFWFCEDYLLTDELDIVTLEKLFRLIVDKELDMFSFASWPQAGSFKPIEAEYESYGLAGEQFYYAADDYMHKLSVQPCIWKKSSLMRLVTENQINLHDLDCSRVDNISSYNVGCTTYRIFDVCPTCPERFVLSYIECIRHGVFLLAGNGFHLYDYWCHDLLIDIIFENNLHKNSEYNKYIMFNMDDLRP